MNIVTEISQDTKPVFIKTYGCQMNEYDSQRIADLMSHHGYHRCAEPTDDGLIILNTCHIREKATEKLYSDLGRLRQLKQQNGGFPVIVVTGCTAQAEGEQIFKRAPYVDIVVGPQMYHRLPELIKKNLLQQQRKQLATDFPVEEKFDFLPSPIVNGHVTAFLTIQEGCDKFCTFCVVPYTRGAQYSRPVADIIREAEGMVAKGVREITLLGQNVNAYEGLNKNGNPTGFADLLRQLCQIDGLERLRFTTSHPSDMTEELCRAFGELEKLMPYLHLPVQAGSDPILKAMNRSHTCQTYCEIIDQVRHYRPDIAISGDFIVGFPGEGEDDFEQTLRLIEKVRYASAFSFKYSRRPGTPAAILPKQIAEDVKDQRLQILQALLRAQQIDFNTSLIGKTLPVLIEKPGRHAGQMVGRSPYLQSVTIQTDARIGTIIPAKIIQARQSSLDGQCDDR